MHERIRRNRPKPWIQHRMEQHRPWAVLFHRVEWYLSWIAWTLGNCAFLDILEHLGKLSVLIAVIFYFSESGNRLKQKHYQAWQVINTAQGKGGNGGRIEALEELNSDRISLVGIDASEAFLQGISLRKANLSRCDFHASDLRNGDFADAFFDFCNLRDANFRFANLSGARMESVAMQGADLHGASLRGAVLSKADMSGVDLRDADLRDVKWQGVASMQLANLAGAQNVPSSFVRFALEHGAVSIAADQQCDMLLQKAEQQDTRK
jgi:uncharacterized protein YjbI with pentapeptide repeats